MHIVSPFRASLLSLDMATEYYLNPRTGTEAEDHLLDGQSYRADRLRMSTLRCMGAHDVQERLSCLSAGRQDVPCYDRWYKWTKFSLNAASAVLGWGVLIVRKGDVSQHKSVDVLYILLLLVRTAEFAKDTIPLVRIGNVPAHQK